MKPLSDQQRLFLVESDQLYRAWREVMWRHDDYRFGIYWKTVKGRDYLVRLNDHAGHGRSLGVRSDATELIYQEFVTGKALAKSKYDGIKARILSQARLNQAIRLGRIPHVIAEVLQKLDQVHALSDLRVVGTHALYAYEAMAAVELRMDLLASSMASRRFLISFWINATTAISSSAIRLSTSICLTAASAMRTVRLRTSSPLFMASFTASLS